MPKPNASIVLNSRDATGGIPQNGNLYNNLLFNAQNQNIIQGQIQSVAVSEVNFPYDIPNVQNGLNVFSLTSAGSTPAVIPVQVPVGFYTGAELAAEINLDISGSYVAPVTFADIPICFYDNVSNRFYFEPPAAPTNPNYGAWFLSSPYTFPVGPLGASANIGKDLLSIMGFARGQSPVIGPLVPLLGRGAAPLTFTQYIDICSPQLCKFQFFRDGSTTNLARRSDVICRLYIANNVATQEEEGTRPFVINRQYTNARVMRWTADNAVGTIDINLYDDVGQPLTTTWLPRSYQITLNCYESPKEDAGM
jgi:hypothetical protein